MKSSSESANASSEQYRYQYREVPGRRVLAVRYPHSQGRKAARACRLRGGALPDYRTMKNTRARLRFAGRNNRLWENNKS